VLSRFFGLDQAARFVVLEDGSFGLEDGMTGTEVLDSARDAIMTTVMISAPLLIVATIVGVAVSLFQALTQIQEQTLVFVPKILAAFATFLVALPFMAETLNNYMLRTASLIAFHK
jgi:flagellar biosynthetic protein FliQ